MVRIRFPPGERPQTIGSAGDFTRLIPIIQNHAGSIVKFLGDGVIATFGVARPSPTYAADARFIMLMEPRAYVRACARGPSPTTEDRGGSSQRRWNWGVAQARDPATGRFYAVSSPEFCKEVDAHGDPLIALHRQ